MSASAADARSPIGVRSFNESTVQKNQRQLSFRSSSSNGNRTQRHNTQSFAASQIQRTPPKVGSSSAVQNAQTTHLAKVQRNHSQLSLSPSSLNVWDTLKGCLPRPLKSRIETLAASSPNRSEKGKLFRVLVPSIRSRDLEAGKSHPLHDVELKKSREHRTLSNFIRKKTDRVVNNVTNLDVELKKSREPRTLSNFIRKKTDRVVNKVSKLDVELKKSRAVGLISNVGERKIDRVNRFIRIKMGYWY